MDGITSWKNLPPVSVDYENPKPHVVTVNPAAARQTSDSVEVGGGVLSCCSFSENLLDSPVRRCQYQRLNQESGSPRFRILNCFHCIETRGSPGHLQ
jgi:hypothetical protein